MSNVHKKEEPQEDPATRGFLKESKELYARYQHYFLHRYQTRYWLVVVRNHFDSVYGFFLESQRIGENLVHSNKLLSLPFAVNHYARVMQELKSFSKLSIEYRDTHHLIKKVPAVTFDPMHGHRHATAYMPEQKRHDSPTS